jgi:micrococcal nuclease
MRPMGDGAPYVSGFDTPEIGRYADCAKEAQLGFAAAVRMAELLETPGLVIEDSGELDPFDRPLIVMRLPDGSTVGQTLIDEGHAVEWRPRQSHNCNPLIFDGGEYRNRTGVHGFAIRCVTTPPTRRWSVVSGCGKRRQDGVEAAGSCRSWVPPVAAEQLLASACAAAEEHDGDRTPQDRDISPEVPAPHVFEVQPHPLRIAYATAS